MEQQALAVLWILAGIAGVYHVVRITRPFERARRAHGVASSGRHEKALAAYDKAIAGLEACARGEEGRPAGRWTLARRDLAQRLLLREGDARTLLGVALAWKSYSLAHLGRMGDALEASGAAMGHGGSDWRVSCARIMILSVCGRHAEAIELAGRSVADHPRKASLHCARAHALRNGGDVAAALKSARAALEIFPDSANVRELCDELAAEDAGKGRRPPRGLRGGI